MTPFFTWRPSWPLALAAVLLAGCATPVDRGFGHSPWARSSLPALSPNADAGTAWQHQRFPGKTPATFTSVRIDGRDSMVVKAVSAASALRRQVRIEPEDLHGLRFSWKVPELIADADLARRDADDSPVRVILVFEGDRARFSARDAVLSELMRTLTGEELPYATLMYVWCNKRSPGTVVNNPRTDRIRKIVVESGAGRLNQWLDYERDIRADYERAFGEAPGALVAVAIMTDSDNTRSTATAWYGPLRLTRSALQR